MAARTDAVAAHPGTVRLRGPVPLYLASFLVIGLSLSVLGPALSDLRERSGTDIGGIGVLFVGQAFGYIVGSFVAGRIYDRVDGHRVFAGALLILAGGLALVASFDSLGALFVTFLVIGAGAACVDVGANALLVWELGAGVGRAMNLLHLCFGVGALCAPLFVHVGLNVATRTAAVACAALALWSVSVASPSAPVAKADVHSDTTPRLLALITAFFLLYVGLEVGYAGWIHTYGEEIDFSPLAATWLNTTFWIGFTVGRALSSVLAPRFRSAGVVAASTALTVAVATGLVIGHRHAAAVWVGSAAMGLATAPQFPMMMTYLERRIHVTGVTTAWFVGAAGLGGLVFPWLIGRWFGASGPAALPWSMLVLGVLTLCSFAVIDRRLRTGAST